MGKNKKKCTTSRKGSGYLSGENSRSLPLFFHKFNIAAIMFCNVYCSVVNNIFHRDVQKSKKKKTTTIATVLGTGVQAIGIFEMVSAGGGVPNAIIEEKKQKNHPATIQWRCTLIITAHQTPLNLCENVLRRVRLCFFYFFKQLPANEFNCLPLIRAKFYIQSGRRDVSQRNPLIPPRPH